ncbi:glycoside hydrolase [bacterium]|nr:glycoside hydrolase [bacterium]
MSKLSIAVVWHMHQPLYKDRLTGQYLMPWVRLHAIKDYLDMVQLLEQFPTLHQTFNLVPSLLEQLIDYGHNGAIDRALELTLMPVREYCLDDKCYLFERFFDLNWDRMLVQHPRYHELALKRNALLAKFPLEKAVRQFDAQEWVDLTVWFNLAWFDPLWQQTDPDLQALIQRGRDFTQADRELVIRKQRELIRRIIPTYKRLAEAGQVELTTTPFYHPILPLLIDTESARVARPGLPLPNARFQYPQDAQAQVRKGLDFFKRHFGYKPAGMWPSEQSVSPAVVPLLASEGVNWMISDEGVLARTLDKKMVRDAHGLLQDPQLLYQPYWVEIEGKKVAMVFRDIVLSDLIGFSYSKVSGVQAANDLIARLKGIKERVGDAPHLVTIALDGENCWEHYAQDGAEFLRSFYQQVTDDPSLEMVTVEEYLKANPPRETLTSLFSGSWISSDFTTWIGDPTKNRAWELLTRAREALASKEGRGLAGWTQAREEIFIAQGSDWYWWFGEGHNSGQDELFDYQFRLHLQNVYRLLEMPVPEALEYPLNKPLPKLPSLPYLPVDPRLDGSAQSEIDWEGSGSYDPAAGQGAMHAAANGISRVRFGHNERELLMRVEFADSFVPTPDDALAVYICYPGQPRINSPMNFGPGGATGATKGYGFAHEIRYAWGEPTATISFAGDSHRWIPIDLGAHSAYKDALDLAIPFRVLSVVPGQEIWVVVALGRNGKLEQVAPQDQPLSLKLPARLATFRALTPQSI